MTHPFTGPDAFAVVEDLAEGGTWLLDLVSAVDHLRRGHRPGLTVWAALNEALDAYVDDDPRPADASNDTLGARFRRLAEHADLQGAGSAQAALRRWVTTMADRYNNGRHWPHPAPRRGFPPPAIDV